jgi:CheY-like chemotaxis protein
MSSTMATILLISDSPPAHELVRSALLIVGHEVLVAHDAASVSARVDLALVDLDRAESAAQVRPRARKVVLLSAATEEVTRERMEQVGAEGYVRRLGPERLRDDVQHLLAH